MFSRIQIKSASHNEDSPSIQCLNTETCFYGSSAQSNKPAVTSNYGNEGLEFVVEEILDCKLLGAKPFLVIWLDEPILTWEPYEFLKDIEALDICYSRYQSKKFTRSQEITLLNKSIVLLTEIHQYNLHGYTDEFRGFR